MKYFIFFIIGFASVFYGWWGHLLLYTSWSVYCTTHLFVMNDVTWIDMTPAPSIDLGNDAKAIVILWNLFNSVIPIYNNKNNNIYYYNSKDSIDDKHNFNAYSEDHACSNRDRKRRCHQTITMTRVYRAREWHDAIVAWCHHDDACIQSNRLARRYSSVVSSRWRVYTEQQIGTTLWYIENSL